MMKAISPDDIILKKAENLPDFVLDEWNKMIAKKFTAGRACVLQNEIIAALLPHTQHGDRKEVFDGHWLDIQEIYRDQGWSVVYDKPGYGYNESYEASFVFKPKASYEFQPKG